MHDGIPGQLGSFPTFVAIHRVIASDDSPNPGATFRELIFDILEVTFTSGRRGVPTIGDGVNHDIVTARFPGHPSHREQLVLMTMHTPI